MKIYSKKDIEVTAYNNKIEEVNDSMISYTLQQDHSNGDSTIDVQCRITKANLRNIWKSSNMRIFKTNLIGVFLYGSES